MSVSQQQPQPQPELDAEQEVDFRRYGTLLAARWWVVVAGLVAGVAVGYLLALGGGSIWQARALVSLGQPMTPGSDTPINYYALNPRNISEIARSASALKVAARKSGMTVEALRGNVSADEVGTGTTSGTGRVVPLIGVTVQGKHPAKVEKAANALAQVIVQRTTATYVGGIISSLHVHLKSLQDRMNVEARVVTELQKAAADKTLAPLDRLSIVLQLNGATQLLGLLQDKQTNQQQELALAQHIESATVVSPAAAEKSSARSMQTSIAVGGLIGLILGMLAAIFWEPLAARFGARPA